MIILKHLILESPEQSTAVQFIENFVLSKKDNRQKLLDYRDINGWSLLHFALFSQKELIVKRLFADCLELFEQKYSEHLELAFFCAKFNCCRSMTVLFELLKFNDQLQLSRALLCAAESNFLNFVQLIIQNKGEIECMNDLHHHFGESLLHIAIKKQNLQLFDLIISLGDRDILNSKETMYGDTPLLYCCKFLQKGDRDSILHMASLLLQNQADPNLPNHKDITPLHLATYYLDETLIYLLLKYNGKVDATSKTGDVPLLMMINSSTPNLDIVLLMLQTNKNVCIDIKCLEQAFTATMQKKEQNKVILHMLQAAITENIEKKQKQHLMQLPREGSECKSYKPKP